MKKKPTKKAIKKENDLVIYQSKNGAIELRGDFKHENIWASQKQIAEIFGINRTVVSRHVSNIFKDNELDHKVVSAKFAHTSEHGAIKGKTQTKEVEFYSLDVILSVGYRTNSFKAIEFRKWATDILRKHITKGYTINPKVIKENYTEFQKAVENIKHLLPKGEGVDNANVVELISAFADTWLSLEAYDENKLASKGVTKKSVALTAEHLYDALSEFKTSLIKKGEASDLFGAERNTGNVAGIVGNVMQSFGGSPVYPTIEEKAAHLLYFMVKNHPFSDGNKRSGAYAFVWFLNRAGVLDKNKISPAALTAITLFVAESDPKNKERMIHLILQLLKK